MSRRNSALSLLCLLSLTACGQTSSVSSSSQSPIKEEYTAFGNVVHEKELAEGYLNVRHLRIGAQNKTFEIAHSDDGALESSFQEGDFLSIESASQYILFSGFGKEVLLYSPRGTFCIEIPKGKLKNTSDMQAFLGNQDIDVRIARASDLSQKRNLAFNPFDQMHIDENNLYNSNGTGPTIDDSKAMGEGAVAFFPHAYASRVTRNEVGFFPRNAIDGMENAEGHDGFPYQSWGYDQKEDATFTLYFGRQVELESLGLVLRHDTKNNHDCAWKKATFEYDGGEVEGEFTFTGEEQMVEFDAPIKTTYIRIKDMVAEKGSSQGYAALTELKAYGKETLSENPLAKKRIVHGAFGGLDQNHVRSSILTADIEDAVERANNWFLQSVEKGTLKIPMYDITRTETVALGEQEWKDSVYYSGLTDYVLTTGYEYGYDYLKGISQSYKYACNGGDFTPHGDWYQIGETYMQLGDLEGTAYPSLQPRENLDWNIAAYPNAPTGSKNAHMDSGRDWTHGGWWWCDALYMAMNSYTLMSRITGDEKYVEAAEKAYDYAKGNLYDDHYHLWHRDSTQLSLETDVADPITGKKYASFWSRGNAWVFAALAKQMLYLDEMEYPELYAKYKADFIEMAESLKEYQREDGLWNVAITPYQKYEGKEITGTCGFIYGFAVGSSLGILDASYMDMADLAYETILDECFIGDTDQLGYMQTVGYQPQNYVSEEFTRPITDEFGMGLFLMASSALLRSSGEYEDAHINVGAVRQGYYVS
ncbi:MAG: glycoside hydrolase family 88 protein [Bacilli bacterium]|nr:glycoside hydrolase family 88 protein [Bacilli bacterium]